MAMFDTVKVLTNDKGLVAGEYQTYDLGQRNTVYVINKSGFLDYVDVDGTPLTTQEGTFGISLYNIETDVTECVHFVNGMISRLISDEEAKSIWELEAPQRELEKRRMSLQLKLNSLKHIDRSATPTLTVSDANEPGIAIAPYHLIGFGQPSKSYSMDAEGVTNICDGEGIPYTSEPGEFILLTNRASGLTYFLEMVDGKITKATKVNEADSPERESAINQPIHVSPLGETVDPMSVGLSLTEKDKEQLRENIARSHFVHLYPEVGGVSIGGKPYYVNPEVDALPKSDGDKWIIGDKMKSVLVKTTPDAEGSDVSQAATVVARPLSERVYKAKYKEIQGMSLDAVMAEINELPNGILLLQKVEGVKEDAAREAVARGILLDIAERIFVKDRIEELKTIDALVFPELEELLGGKQSFYQDRAIIADKTPVDVPELTLVPQKYLDEMVLSTRFSKEKVEEMVNRITKGGITETAVPVSAYFGRVKLGKALVTGLWEATWDENRISLTPSQNTLLENADQSKDILALDQARKTVMTEIVIERLPLDAVHALELPNLTRLVGERPESRSTSLALMSAPTSESLERHRRELEASWAKRWELHLEQERPLLTLAQQQMLNAANASIDLVTKNRFIRELVKSMAESRAELYGNAVAKLTPSEYSAEVINKEDQKWIGFIEHMKQFISPLLIEEFDKILAGGNEPERDRFVSIMQMQESMPKSHVNVIEADASKMRERYVLPSYVKKVLRDKVDVIEFFANMVVDSMKFSLATGNDVPLTVIYSLNSDDRNVYFIKEIM